MKETDDICGLCGELGADKFCHPVHWPTEKVPKTDLVHAKCEREEGMRAFEEYRSQVGENGIKEFLRIMK